MRTDSLGLLKTALSAGVALGLTTGCRDMHRHDEAESAESDHDHEVKTHQITAWSDQFEIFAEFKPVAAGREFELVAHVTSLETRAPRVEGPLHLRLRRGDQVVEQIEEQPAHPGIYVSTLRLNDPGVWEMSIELPGSDDGSTVVLPALEVHADAHDAAHAEVPHLAEGIPFLKEQQWRIRLGTERVTRRRLVERLVFPGQAIAKPGTTTTVVAPVTARIAAPPGRSALQLGDRVDAGQVMAMLELGFSDAAARLAEAEAELAQAKVALNQAQTAHARVQQLAAKEAKSQRELEESEAVLAMARARLDAATALQLTYRLPGGESAVPGAALPSLELRAPIAGIVNRLHAGVGEMVAPNMAVVQLIDPSMVWLEARIPESHLGRLDTAIDTLYERLDALGIYRVIENRSGVFLGLEVDPQTRTAPLTFEVPNGEDPLRIGQSVRLHVGTARAEQALALPEAAIVEEGGRPMAFVQVSGETFEKRELVLGMRDGPWVQVLEGVAEGERVVTEGAYVVRLASVSSMLPAHGHAH